MNYIYTLYIIINNYSNYEQYMIIITIIHIIVVWQVAVG